MDNVDKFLNMFSDFDLVVVPKHERRKPVAEAIRYDGETKANLKKALKRLEKEYKQALRSFKANKITKSELYDFEWRIFELQEEIKRLERGE